MPNRLADSSSPYLRQHMHNPVDWYPWCKEALDKARREDKPIFLSIGYSACHWCHVMEHESFENDQIAAILNEHFVSIKVDREERPDLDQIYMQAVQMMIGSGGWPMSVFLTPGREPFYGGTYWPPEARYGRPGFIQVLNSVIEAWKNKRENLEKQSQQITSYLQDACRGPEASDTPLSQEWLVAADRWLQQHHDTDYGGFGGAPKFPHAIDLSLLIELQAIDPQPERREVIDRTLTKMAQGGIYDHLGGGFARYSVDKKWLVPHFEKMLYDNALLAIAYADAYRLWQTQAYGRVVSETLDYVLRDMTHPLGGFLSTEDADSEGVEGKFYVWSPAEVKAVLGPQRGDVFCQVYDVTSQGNFEGHNILNLRKPIDEFARQLGIDADELRQQLTVDRAALLDRRGQRVRPSLDDKVLVSWNGLMISAFIHGYRSLLDDRYLQAARGCVQFLQQHLRQPDGALWHCWRDGSASVGGYLDDYTYLIAALCELFQVDADPGHLQFAIELTDILLKHFSDETGGFYFTANNQEQLIARSRDLVDTSVPSSNAMAACGLLSLGRITGNQVYLQAAEQALIATSGVMTKSPQAAGQALRGMLRFLQPSKEWVLVGEADSQDWRTQYAKLIQPFDPRRTVIAANQTSQLGHLEQMSALMQQRTPIDGQTTLWVCEQNVCQQPLTGAKLTITLSSL